MTTTPKPSAIFASIARQVPATAAQVAEAPAKAQNPIQDMPNSCSTCGVALRPTQVHVPGGFECRENQGQL